MGLKDCLEQRVAACTVFPDCAPLRFSVLIWNENDSKANTLCENVRERGCGDIAFISVKNGENAYDLLKNCLAKAEKKQKLGERIYPRGNYLLVVASTLELYDAVNVQMLKQHFQNTIIEFCRIAEFGASINETIAKKNLNFTAEWRTDVDESRTVSVFLSNATYETNLLSNYLNTDTAASPVFEVKSKEYSAIREAICRQALVLLSKQIEPVEQLAANAHVYLSMGNYRSVIMENCPRPEWLPILGYKEFKKELSLLKKWILPSWSYISQSTDANVKNISMTVREAICRLFGKEGQEPRPEWLRKTIEAKTMPLICDNTVNRNRDRITNILKSYFSLYDIQYKLIFEIQKCADDAKAAMEECKDKLSKALDEEYTWHSKKPAGLLKGFHEYYALWEQWLETCAEACWWNSIGNLLLEIKQQTAVDYNDLKNAKEMVQGICINGMELSPISHIDNENKNILNVDSLKKFIRHALYIRGFENNDIIDIMRALDKEYTDGVDFHVDSRYRPIIFLLSSERVFWEEPLRDLNFQWKHVPCRYVPKSILYELKIYLRTN